LDIVLGEAPKFHRIFIFSERALREDAQGFPNVDLSDDGRLQVS